MDRVLGGDTGSSTIHRTISPTHCSICERRTSAPMVTLAESVAVSGSRQSWTLCRACADAVEAEMQRADLRPSLRMRVAVAMVATERSPRARPKIWDDEFWEQLSERQWNVLIAIWVIALAVLAPLLFVLVAALASTQR
jgi:hypothetical protein